MSKILRLCQTLNILSIDIAAGAVICCAFFADILGVSVLPYGFITLGLTVWIIYTVDHLLDVWRKTQPAATKRHRFHQQHFYILLTPLLLSLVVVGIQLVFIRRPVLIGGVVLSAIVGLYFILQKSLKYFKEFIVAILYSGGVLMAPLSFLQRPLAPFEISLIFQFFLTALINLLLFSWFDRKSDAQDHHPSFTVAFGDRATRILLTVSFIMNAGISVIQIFLNTDTTGPVIVILAMNAVLVWIFLKRNYFEINDRYRLMGDAAFLLPVVYLTCDGF